MSRGSRNYPFTLNNYTEEEVTRLTNLGNAEYVRYLIFGYEIGPKCGTPHLQGFMIFMNSKTHKAVKKLLSKLQLNRVHYDEMYAKSSPYECMEYCKKDRKFIEMGVAPINQGKRTDLEFIVEKVKEGESIKGLIDNSIVKNYQQLKWAESMLKLYETPRNWKPEVYWFYGSTGTGKTKKAYQMFAHDSIDNLYVAMSNMKWWDGYDGHPYVIIDDIRKDSIPFNELLRLLDRYQYRVETKGGTRQFRGRRIVITCPYHPKQLYYGEQEDIGQLIRRIDIIKNFDEDMIVE